LNFVLPACHSSFSLLYGTASPEKLVETAVEAGYRELLLADSNNLYGAYDFYYAARERGIPPLIGARLGTALGNLLLICENHDGYRNLCRLVSDYHLEGEPGAEVINRYSANLVCVAEVSASTPVLRELFGERLYAGIGLRGASRRYLEATKKKLKAAALPDAAFLKPEDFETHRLLRAIGGGFLLKNLPPNEMALQSEYLHDPAWYRKCYRDFPQTVPNTIEIKERCRIVFPEAKNILPDIDIPGDHFECLREKAVAGLQKRTSSLSGEYQARLEYELNVIRQTGFIDYFLIVQDIVAFCHANDIAVVGRGSAAGSLVSYSLGITEVDPIKEGLYFERFLNEARSDCPDVDLDIDWRKRDDVLDYVYDKYGAEHVAMIATYTRFQPRLAVRETAKALGFSPEDIGRFVKYIPRMGMNGPIEPDKVKPSSLTGRHIWDRFAPVLKLSHKLAGLPRHLGIHSGGIVITPRPLTDYVPLERAAKGIVVTQCDMYQAEKIGLVKIDILGQRGLAVIADCRKKVRELKGDDFRIPELDAKTYDMLRSGKTVGVFQIESPGLRALLRDLQPTELNDITLALALIRPGASESGMKKVFLDRFHKKETTAYPHPNLEETLRETYGVFIYQEQVILAAQKIAGFNMAASDQLRRAITKKRKEKDQEALKRRFLSGAERCMVAEDTAYAIFLQLRQFASFGFCKAHAATYGYLAYQSAYYKAHYPAIFMTAVLRNGGGYYPSAVYVAEARRLGITIVPPDVNLSDEVDTLIAGKVYLGLNRIRELTGRSMEQILKYRPFVDLFDFTSRIEISQREMENLIKSGFFDSLESSRAELLWKYRLWGKKALPRKEDLFGAKTAGPVMKKMPELVQFSRYDIFRAEREILGLAASFHPLTLFSTYRAFNPEVIYGSDNRELKVRGWRADIKRIKTRDGKYMVFMTLDSLDDTFEVVLFPDIYNRYAELIRAYRYLSIEGWVSLEEGSPAIMAERIEAAPTGLEEARYV